MIMGESAGKKREDAFRLSSSEPEIEEAMTMGSISTREILVVEEAFIRIAVLLRMLLIVAERMEGILIVEWNHEV